MEKTSKDINKTIEDIKNLSLADFLDRLASSDPVPGGGGAVALTGALGAALGSMVGVLTSGKKKYRDIEEDVLKWTDKINSLRHDLLRFIELDAEAFLPLSRAYSIPKDDPGRDTVLEECLREAARVPFELLNTIRETLDLLDLFATNGSVIVISDAATGALLCRAAAEGALMNVKVNTRLMKDLTYAKELDLKAEELSKSCALFADDIYRKVLRRLNL
jgi:formiminotetrahydrofolate cyclodeaminase